VSCLTVETTESAVDVLPSSAQVTIEAIAGANVLIESECGSPVNLEVVETKITITTPPVIQIQTTSGATVQIESTIIDEIGDCFSDKAQDFEYDLTYFWYGWESYEGGGWLIERQLRSDSSCLCATSDNNPTVTNYADALTNRDNLVYE